MRLCASVTETIEKDFKKIKIEVDIKRDKVYIQGNIFIAMSSIAETEKFLKRILKEIEKTKNRQH